MGSGGEDRDNRAVILTGSGDAFMDAIDADVFDFFTPLGYDKILREGRKALSNILDVEIPSITALKVRRCTTPNVRCCPRWRSRRLSPRLPASGSAGGRSTIIGGRRPSSTRNVQLNFICFGSDLEVGRLSSARTLAGPPDKGGDCHSRHSED